MSSTNFTTHYSIPLPLGTDLTTPMDYNEAAEAVDTALFAAETDAGNASTAASNAVDTANAAANAVDTVAADLTQEKAKIVALQTRVTNAENEIDDVRADSSDMITAYNEPTATSTHAYAIGDFFIYNNTLYKATAAIAIGATIVPDTNCETTNVSSELIEIKSAFNDELTSITANGTSTFSQMLDYLHSQISDIDTFGIKLVQLSSSNSEYSIYNLRASNANTKTFSNISISGDNLAITKITVSATGSAWVTNNGTVTTNYSDTVPASGTQTLKIVKIGY